MDLRNDDQAVEYRVCESNTAGSGLLTSSQNNTDLVYECEKLKEENNNLRQCYFNAQATINSLRARYKDSRKALLRQLDINKRREDEFKKIKLCQSHCVSSTNDYAGSIALLNGPLVDKNIESVIETDQLRRDVEFWQTKYHQVKRDYEAEQSHFDHLSKCIVKNMEAIEIARKKDTSTFREKVFSVIQGQYKRDYDRISRQRDNKYTFELQDANIMIQKLKSDELQIRNELIDATNKIRQDECLIVDLENSIALERAEAVRKIVVLEKEISSLDSTVKSQNHQIDRYKTDIQVNTDKISSLMNENNSMESELEKLKTKFADCKSNQELAHEKYQRMSEVENTALQIRVNELERTNDDLTHQIVELHDILRKQKHDHLLLVEQTARDNHNLLMKYRNDNTTLTVQLSNYMDKLTVQEKAMSSDILMLKRDRDKFCHDAIQLKNQLDLTSATVSNAIQSEERLKMSRTETESKLLLVEKEKRDLVIKSNENEHEVSMLIEKCRILEKNLDKVSCESLMLREQLQVVNDAYEQENSQTRANLENFRVQQEEQVEILKKKLQQERRKSAAYKDKLLDEHRKNIEARAALSMNPKSSCI